MLRQGAILMKWLKLPGRNFKKSPSKVIRRFPGILVEAEISGQTIRFFVNNREDWIQRHHDRGEFYEVTDLNIMAQHMTRDTRYLDVGANVGNHVIWLSKFVGLKNIVVVEPHPKAVALLEMNLRINDLIDKVDLSCTGYGLSDSSGIATVREPENNLGGTRLVRAFGEGLPLRTGDELLGDRDFDFIKIDVESMEIQCLQGLSNTISRCRPTMFIEVDNVNAPAFDAWVADNRYSIVNRHRAYTVNENFLIKPDG
jgi:FkbM family methyltransferase